MEIVNVCSFLLFDKCAFISVMNYRGFPLVILKRFVQTDNFILYRRSFFMKNTPVWKTYIF